MAILAICRSDCGRRCLLVLSGHQTASASAATSSQTYTQVVPVKQGTLSSTISVVGQLEAVQDADLAFEHMSGTATLQSLAVKAGSVVTTGQVLATINATPIRRRLTRPRAPWPRLRKPWPT